MTTRDPIRLRELDPLFDALVEQAHANLPGPTTVDAILQAVRGTTAPSVPAPRPALTAPIGPLDAVRSAAPQLGVVAAVSSGLIWAAHIVWPMPTEAPSAPIVTSVRSQSAQNEPVRPRSNAMSAGDRVSWSTSPAAQSRADAAQRPVPRLETGSKQIARRPSSHAPRLARERAFDDRDHARGVDFEGHPPEASPAYRLSPQTAAPARISNEPSVEREPRDEHALAASEPRNPEEVELLDEAQEALRTSPARAFELTDRHRQKFPRGAFIQEREQIAIEALHDLGQVQSMRERAARFHKAFPNSPYTARIDELVAAMR